MSFMPEPLYPVIILILGALGALMLGSLTRKALPAFTVALVTLGLTIAGLLTHPATGAVSFEGGPVLLAFSPFSNLVGLMLAVLGLLLLPLLWQGFAPERRRAELAVLLLLTIAGGTMLAAATNLLTLYGALELLSFPLYILCAWNREDAKSSEAGLKYFVLGSFASGLMLFGASFIYAATGTLDFNALVSAAHTATPLFVVGSVLVFSGVAFKLSLAPFHFYTPDVYEGAPTPITAMLAALPKIAVGALAVRLLAGPFGAEAGVTLGQGVAVLAILSMALGAPLALVQGNLKRLLAFSTVANMGFVAVPLVALTTADMPLQAEAASGALFYLFVYALTSVGLFAAIQALSVTQVNDLKGLGKRSPWMATALGTLLFSLAGIPPLAGFMGKLLAFLPAVQAGYGLLVLLAVVFSVVASAYSLWLIKVIVFDELGTRNQELGTRKSTSPLSLVIGICAFGVLLIGLFPAPLQTLCLASSTAIY